MLTKHATFSPKKLMNILLEWWHLFIGIILLGSILYFILGNLEKGMLPQVHHILFWRQSRPLHITCCMIIIVFSCFVQTSPLLKIAYLFAGELWLQLTIALLGIKTSQLLCSERDAKVFWKCDDPSLNYGICYQCGLYTTSVSVYVSW